jgi:pimeloyl-ACP methyl ester carboxylesterase
LPRLQLALTSFELFGGSNDHGRNFWQRWTQEHDITANGISLHVTEQGTGPAILFAHGFPDTSYTWRKQMKAVAEAGYRAIAPDMRGYGRSSAPTEAALYTPFQTVGDLVGLGIGGISG